MEINTYRVEMESDMFILGLLTDREMAKLFMEMKHVGYTDHFIGTHTHAHTYKHNSLHFTMPHNLVVHLLVPNNKCCTSHTFMDATSFDVFCHTMLR